MGIHSLPERACRSDSRACPIRRILVDCNRYQLLRSGRLIKMERLPMGLLILLPEKKGQLASL